MTQLQETDAQTISNWVNAGEAVLVDVREADEWAEVRIAGAVHIPMSAFDPDAVPKGEDGKKVVFYCAMGMRSFQVGQYMLNQGLLDEAYNLTGGITAWAQMGLPFEHD